jgi:endoglucanase
LHNERPDVIRSLAPKIYVVGLAVVALIGATALTHALSTAASVPQNPLKAEPFYNPPGSGAAASEHTDRRAGLTKDANLMQQIAREPVAIWLNSSASVRWMATNVARARRRHRLPTFVIYNIPDRDCGSYSSGGAPNASAYRAWIRSVAAHLGHVHTAVVVEPDALAEMSCWSRSEQSLAYTLIRYAAKTIAARPDTTVYLDAGNAAWQPARTMVERLRHAGVGMVRGFSLNVSNFINTPRTIAYGNRIAKALGGKHYVIDTSRNGRGAYRHDGALQWCNPPGRALGTDPTTDTASPLVDAYLWVKSPGESDGPCNGGPPSGVWWPAYALGLAERSK